MCLRRTRKGKSVDSVAHTSSMTAVAPPCAVNVTVQLDGRVRAPVFGRDGVLLEPLEGLPLYFVDLGGTFPHRLPLHRVSVLLFPFS